MNRRYGPGVAAGIILACVATGGVRVMFPSGNQKFANATGLAASARLLKAATGFAKGELPAIVKISNSSGFDGYYENSGSTKSQTGDRVEFAFDGEHLLYYDHTKNQWILNSTTGKPAKCRPPKPEVLPEHGNWTRDDGSNVRIDIEGFNVLPGRTIRSDRQKRKKLEEVINDVVNKKPGNDFEVGVDADGRRQSNEVDKGGKTRKPNASNEAATGGDASASQNTSNRMVGVVHAKHRHDVEQGDTTSQPNARSEEMTSSFHATSLTTSNPMKNRTSSSGVRNSLEEHPSDVKGDDEHRHDVEQGDATSQPNARSEEMTNSFHATSLTTSNPMKNRTSNSSGVTLVSSHQRPVDVGENSLEDDEDDKGNTSNLEGTTSDFANQVNSIKQRGQGSRNSSGEDRNNNVTNNRVGDAQDPRREFPLGYKILLLALALLSLICACICTIGSCLAAEKGKKEPIPLYGALSDDASDMEDVESKAFVRR